MRGKYVTVVHASARGVASRWALQYFKDGKWRSEALEGRAKQIYDALSALGENPDIDDVARIIGNKSWSYTTCDGCSNDVAKAISIGEHEPKNYCETCINEAHEVLTREA